MSTKTEVWFGVMTHGMFYVGDKDDEVPCVIIHSIDEKRMMDVDAEDIDDLICGSDGYDSYLVPSEFKGVVVFSSKEVAL